MLAGLTAIAVVLLVVVGGAGWLYVLWRAGVLSYGPQVDWALPLQQLAGDAAQPLARLAAAWLPAGLFAGLALAGVTRLSAGGRAAVVGVISGLALAAAGSASDALTVNEPLTAHIAAQLHHPAAWVEAGLMIIGSLFAGRR